MYQNAGPSEFWSHFLQMQLLEFDESKAEAAEGGAEEEQDDDSSKGNKKVD